MTEGPEVLAVIVEAPLGAGEDAAGGEFEEEGGNVAVLILRGIVGDALEEGAGVEGEQKMCVVNEVEGEHGAAVEEELRDERLEAEGRQGDAERRFRTAGMAGNGCKKNEQREVHSQQQAAEHGEMEGNLHGSGRVSVFVRVA